MIKMENALISEESVLSYRLKIQKEKKLFEKFDLIETGKTPHENFSSDILPAFPSDVADKYSLKISLMQLVVGLDSTNLNLVEAYELWERIQKRDYLIDNTFVFGRAWKLNTYIIHDIKYCVDMLISLVWWLSQPKICKKITINSVGAYINRPDNDFDCFDNFLGFFRMVNDIENAHKHSLPNLHNVFIGSKEPTIYALVCSHNKDVFHPKLAGSSLKVLIQDFNKFYRFSLSLLLELANNKAEAAKEQATEAFQ